MCVNPHSHIRQHVSVCASLQPHVIVHPGLVPVTVCHHMALLSGIPWLPGIMRDVHDVPWLSSWEQAGLLSLPMRLCGRGGPAEPLPAVDRSSLCGQGTVCRSSQPIDLPLSAQCTLILASACGCPGLASWVCDCVCGPEPAVPIVLSIPIARPALRSIPQSQSISLGGLRGFGFGN